MAASTPISVRHLCKSQFGEDLVLWRVFRGKSSGYFVEVGAFDGVTLSNTYFLEQMGWRGLLVEPIEECCGFAAAARPRSRVIHAAASRRGHPPTATFTVADNVAVLSFLTADQDHKERCLREGAVLREVQVPVVTLNDVLAGQRRHGSEFSPWKQNVGWDIDLISIDVEGGELDVLDGLSLERFAPRVLLLENDRNSGAEIQPYLSERGYRKFHRQVINDFYVREACASELHLDGL